MHIPYGAPHVPVDESQVLVRVADAALVMDEVHDSVLLPEQAILTATHVFALIWYPMLQLVTVHVLYADHIPVALLHVLV